MVGGAKEKFKNHLSRSFCMSNELYIAVCISSAIKSRSSQVGGESVLTYLSPGFLTIADNSQKERQGTSMIAMSVFMKIVSTPHQEFIHSPHMRRSLWNS